MLSRFGQNVAMRLDEAYRALDLSPAASEEEVKAAHRDLTKVWHPDRFANDAAMRQKAEEKLKLINEAFETIRSGGSARTRWSPGPAPQPTTKDKLRSLLIWMFACVFLALFILVRRPTFGGVLIAVVLFAVAAVLIRRMNRLEKGS
ncbi:MAG TPA: J domain-containing protein [Thermoanaerobaculia bacterium]|nr:J domain-containing protein [Thermoanaerobaculia bacterium]